MLSRTASSLLRRQSARSFCRATAPSAVSAASASTLAAPTPAAAYGAVPRRRNFSDNTHDDFAPKKTTIEEGEDEAIQMIQQHVTDNPVMLYMKGNPSSPMCGFSAKIVQTLQAEGIDFSSVNVLDYPSIREGVKKFAAWPTIPQLYINGEFVGGTDVVTEMHESGELKEMLEEGNVKQSAADEKK